jgi:murein DD-endopeptidase MepM/ murein hydrolase activator NlpD
MSKKKYRIIVLLTCALSVASTVWGDIYRHDNGDETISFTDSPSDDRYTLIMREHKPRISKIRNERNTLLLHKSENKDFGSTEQKSRFSGELPVKGVITSSIGYRNDPFDGRLRHHNGMDIAAPSGTPVKPVAPGTVIFSGWRGGYGNAVIIEHADGMLTVYAHHSLNPASEGATVDCSTIIALSGSTGRSTGPHLHFEAWRNGENITGSFLPAGTLQQKLQVVTSAPVKRYLQPDGTILFTNLR